MHFFPLSAGFPRLICSTASYLPNSFYITYLAANWNKNLLPKINWIMNGMDLWLKHLSQIYVNRSCVHCKSNPKTTSWTGFLSLQTNRAIPETSDLTNILSERQWGTRVDQNIQWQRQTLKIVLTLFDSHKSANIILAMFHPSNFVKQRITYLQNMCTHAIEYRDLLCL